jgi:ATP adenylyltransferase
MDNLWAPWRIEYVRAPKEEDGCIFCDLPDANDDQKSLIILRGATAYVVLNRFPYNNAHLLIAPFEHNSEFDALAAGTQQEMLSLATRSMAVLRKELDAGGFNFGANIGTAAGAGIEEHVHLHVVPRWTGDTNFMPVIGTTKVQVQGLQDTWEQLSKALASTD